MKTVLARYWHDSHKSRIYLSTEGDLTLGHTAIDFHKRDATPRQILEAIFNYVMEYHLTGYGIVAWTDTQPKNDHVRHCDMLFRVAPLR